VTNESASVYKGNSCATFTSNASGGYEKAYLERTLSLPINESYVQACFKFTQCGLKEDGDRIKLIELRGGAKIVAAAGLLVDNGIKWWMETRNGSSYVERLISPLVPNISDWFNLELKWLNGATAGGASLWVNGALVYNVTKCDTNDFGGCSKIRIGIAEIFESSNTEVNVDNAIISRAYIGDKPREATLTVEKSDGGTTNPATGTYQYLQGELVTVQAFAAVENNYYLNHWLLNGTNAGITDNFTLVMHDNYNLTAIFKEDSAFDTLGEILQLILKSGIPSGLYYIPAIAVLLVAASAMVLTRTKRKAAAKS
jgi:hypothetical protein